MLFTVVAVTKDETAGVVIINQFYLFDVCAKFSVSMFILVYNKLCYK